MGRFCDLGTPKSQQFFLLFISLLCFLLVAPLSAHAGSTDYYYDPGSRANGMLDTTNGTAQYTFDKSGNITDIAKNTISSLTVLQATPSGAAIGGTVTIAGTGFGTTSNTSVSFNGTAATPSAVTSTSITVAVPSGATTGTLSVTAPLGTAYLAPAFTILPSAAPTITSFTTGTGTPTTANIGDTVTITGTNFDTTYSKVLVNNQFAQITSASATSLVITVPPSSSGKIVVQTLTGSATSSSDLIIAPPSYATTSISSVRTTVGASPVTVTNGGSGTVGVALFDVTAGQKLTVGMNYSSEPGCYFNAVLLPNGSDFFPSTSTCANYYFMGPLVYPQAGTYSAQLLPSSSGSFTTQIFSVPADATQAITVGGSIASLSTTAPGQQGNFTFPGTSADTISIYFDLSSMPGCSTYALYNPDGTAIYSPTNTCSNPNWIGSPFVISQTGTYTLNITPNLVNAGDGVGTVTASVWNVPSAATQSMTIGGGTVSLSISDPGQQGNFTFSGTSSQNISLFLDLTSMPNCSTYTLINPDSSVLFGPTSVCYNGNWISSPFVLPQTGTYTLNVVPQLASSGSGIGTVKSTAFGVPSPATNTVTVGGGASTISITTPGQHGSFTFSGTSGNAYTTSMDFTYITTCSTYSVLNPDSTVLYGPTHTCSNTPSTGSLTVSQTGTFTITITPDLNTNGQITDGTGTAGATVTSP